MSRVKIIIKNFLILTVCVVAAGCSQGDMSTPEGQFKGCLYHVRQMKSALDSTVRVRGNLEGIRTVSDVNRLVAQDETARADFEEKGKMFCEYIKVLVDGESGGYTLSAYPMVAPQCEIIAEPTGVSPRTLAECM